MLVGIEVTAADIAAGSPDCVGCPVSLALSRAVRPGVCAHTFADRVHIDGYPCPCPDDSLRRVVLAFDAGEAVEPGVVLLDVPERALTRFREGFLPALQGAA